MITTIGSACEIGPRFHRICRDYNLLILLIYLSNTPDFDDEEAEKLPRALEDMMNRENDFPARAHCLVRWYGLREFVTICPSNPSHPIMSPSKAKLLLSSAGIAANNTNW